MNLVKEYWDSCLWISYLNDLPEEKGKVDIIDILIRKAQKPNSNILIVVSTIVLAEIQPRDNYNQIHYQEIREMFYKARHFIKVQAVTSPIADIASQFRTNNPNVNLFDAIQMSTAALEGCHVLYTLDGSGQRQRPYDILKFNGVVMAPGLPPLNIQVPVMPPDSQLSLT